MTRRSKNEREVYRCCLACWLYVQSRRLFVCFVQDQLPFVLAIYNSSQDASERLCPGRVRVPSQAEARKSKQTAHNKGTRRDETASVRVLERSLRGHPASVRASGYVVWCVQQHEPEAAGSAAVSPTTLGVFNLCERGSVVCSTNATYSMPQFSPARERWPEHMARSDGRGKRSWR
jgi:hypothetical protein